jgi:dipeptidyl aminopeptidase/acylaminoacyl peptidase
MWGDRPIYVTDGFPPSGAAMREGVSFRFVLFHPPNESPMTATPLHRIRILPALVLALCLASTADAQQRAPLTAQDLWSMTRVGGLDVAPDGRAALFTATEYDIKGNKGNGDIWVLPLDGSEARRFTTGKSTESQAVWSPDGRRIAFVAKRDDNERAQLYVIDVTGGEARQLTDMPLGAGAPKWFPDGRRIAFTSQMILRFGDNTDSLKAELKRRKESKVSALASENRVIRYWDRYVVDDLLTHIYAVDVETKKITDLTPAMDRFFSIDGGADFDIAPDGRELVVTALTEGPPYRNGYSDLFTLPSDGSGLMRNITAANRADDHSPRYTPDGKYILFGRQVDTTKNAERVRLMRMDRATGTAIELCQSFDRSPSNWIVGDAGRTVYFTAEDRAKQSIFSVPMKGGAVSEVFRGGTNSGLCLAGTRLVFLHQNISAPGEVYSIVTNGKDLRKLTSFNDERLAKIEMGRVEDVRYVGADGDSVQAYIVYPPGFDASKKWPLLVLLHGGPHGTFGDDFHPRWNHQLFAAPGYVAIAPNFHGSTSFGEQFAECINGAHPEKPYVDVMAAVDYMLARGFIDSTRMAAGGGSYGGFLTSWIGTQTSRFACLINHAGVYNLMAQFGSDITWGRHHQLRRNAVERTRQRAEVESLAVRRRLRDADAGAARREGLPRTLHAGAGSVRHADGEGRACAHRHLPRREPLDSAAAELDQLVR